LSFLPKDPMGQSGGVEWSHRGAQKTSGIGYRHSPEMSRAQGRLRASPAIREVTGSSLLVPGLAQHGEASTLSTVGPGRPRCDSAH
jgi:hypothetical protein